MIDRFAHIPLYIQLKEDLISKIKSGVWDVNSQIPTEKELMGEYSVGRATVREAISLLVNEGYLLKKQGIGTFVAKDKPSLGFEPLISLAFALKAKGLNQKNIIEANQIITPDKKLLEKLNWEENAPCFYLKRIRYAESTPVAIENSYFPENFKASISNFDISDSLAKILIEDLKINICKVTQTIILRAASKEESLNLKLEPEIRVLELERWIYTENSKDPFYYLNFIIPENICSFPIESP